MLFTKFLHIPKTMATVARHPASFLREALKGRVLFAIPGTSIRIRTYTNSARITWKKDKFGTISEDSSSPDRQQKQISPAAPEAEQPVTTPTKTALRAVSATTLSTVPWLGHRQIPFILLRLVEAGPFDDVSFQKTLNRGYMIIDSFEPRDVVLLVNALLKVSSFATRELEHGSSHPSSRRAQEGTDLADDSLPRTSPSTRGKSSEDYHRRRRSCAVEEDLISIRRTRLASAPLDTRKRSAVRVAAADEFLAKLLARKLPSLIRKNFLREDLGRSYRRGLPDAEGAGVATAAVGATRTRAASTPADRLQQSDSLNEAFLRIQKRKRLRDICGLVEIFNLLWAVEGRWDSAGWRFLAPLLALRQAIELHAGEFDAAQTAFLLSPNSFLHDVGLTFFSSVSASAQQHAGTRDRRTSGGSARFGRTRKLNRARGGGSLSEDPDHFAKRADDEDRMIKNTARLSPPVRGRTAAVVRPLWLPAPTFAHVEHLLNFEKCASGEDVALFCEVVSNFVERCFVEHGTRLCPEENPLCDLVCRKLRVVAESPRLTRLVGTADAAVAARMLNSLSRLFVAAEVAEVVSKTAEVSSGGAEVVARESCGRTASGERVRNLVLDRLIVPLLVPRLAMLGDVASREAEDCAVGVFSVGVTATRRIPAVGSAAGSKKTTRLSTKQLATLFRGAGGLDRALGERDPNLSLSLKKALCQLAGVAEWRYQRTQLKLVWRAARSMGLLLEEDPMVVGGGPQGDERLVVEELRRGLSLAAPGGKMGEGGDEEERVVGGVHVVV